MGHATVNESSIRWCDTAPRKAELMLSPQSEFVFHNSILKVFYSSYTTAICQ